VVVAEATPDATPPAPETTAIVATARTIEYDIQSALIEARGAAPVPETAVDEALDTPQVVTRLSTSGGRHWGINVGRYPSRYAAEKVLLKTALTEMSTLDGTLRKVVRGNRGFEANFVGMTRETADLACRRLQARQIACFTIGPS
ncbi:MAG: D-alanyl-D-alanine carboxypeptidase, partial [Rhodobacteraceae bacterium]|nr:D-alanyl-D-alanine carboxypeptidase [Paracoccaceae bacterium]